MTNTITLGSLPFLYRGEVLSNNDPMNLGRCKVKVPSVHGIDGVSPEMLPWARAITPFPFSPKRGSYAIPEVGDIVWILFEGGNTQSPVYIGGTIGTKDIPLDKRFIVIYQEGNNSIKYDRESKSFSMNIGSSSVRVSGDSVSISSPNILLEGNVTISGDTNFLGDTNLEDKGR